MSFMKSKKPAQMSDEASMKEGKPSLAIAFSTQRHNKKKMAFGGKAEATQEPAVPGRKEDDQRPAKDAYMGEKFATGGKVGGAETSTSGNKTKTGGSNPGGASTGGAGTVTITTGNKPPKSISVSDVGGKTDARNAGGMDPNEDDHDTMMALGGAVEGKAHSGRLYDRDPGAQAPKPDDYRRPEGSFMARDWAGAPELDDASDTGMRPAQNQYMGDKFARGGEVHPSELMTDDERSSSIAEAIMRKRKMMAEGGQVDLEENSEESLNNEDQMSFEAGDKEQYDLSQLSSQPEDSNEKGDSREAATSDKHDMISQIRAKMKAKRGV